MSEDERTVSVFNYHKIFLNFYAKYQKKKKNLRGYKLLFFNFFFHEQNSLLLLLSVKTYH